MVRFVNHGLENACRHDTDSQRHNLIYAGCNGIAGEDQTKYLVSNGLARACRRQMR